MIVVVFLFPLALYCFALGVINRRGSPLMVPATWDFVGLLGAASGFLVLGVPAMLSGFSEYWRTVWIVGRTPSQPVTEGPYEAWMFVSVSYFAAILGVAALVLWRRRLQTAVYNVETSVFEEVLQGVFESLGLGWMRSGNRYLLARSAGQRTEASEGTREAVQARAGAPLVLRPSTSLPSEEDPREVRACLELDLAPTLYHATLRWEIGGAELRSLVEGELERILPEVRTRDNPMAGWLLACSTVLLGLTVVAMGALIVARILGR